MKLLIAAITLCSLSYAQPPNLSVAADAPVALAPNLTHQLRGGGAATVTNKSDKTIEWITFQLRTRDSVSTDRVSVDIRPGDKERVELTMLGTPASHPDMRSAELTIISVEFAGGTSWKSR